MPEAGAGNSEKISRYMLQESALCLMVGSCCKELPRMAVVYLKVKNKGSRPAPALHSSPAPAGRGRCPVVQLMPTGRICRQSARDNAPLLIIPPPSNVGALETTSLQYVLK